MLTAHEFGEARKKTFLSLLFKATLVFVFLLSQASSNAQNIGIGTTSPNNNAMLDVSSGSKGILIPRMDSVSRKAIPNTKGLMVYDTTYHCFWYNDGTMWVNLPPRGNSIGDMSYWNGSRWVIIPVGQGGQVLTLTPGSLVPAWAGYSVPLASLTTSSVTGITGFTATGGGNVTSDGGSFVTARGVCWSTTTSPTTSNSKTTDGSGTGSFASSITGLSPNTTYYVRAYATTANGTAYGSEQSFTTTAATFTVGQSYGGGIIFYVDGTGQHGLIAASADQSSGMTWNNNITTTTNATQTAIGTGLANTNTIINVLGSGNHAAAIARSYTGGGYNDWYLPSKDELNLMYNNLHLAGLGNFSMYYWSSSESGADAWGQFFTSGTQSQVPKDEFGYVRAIRTF